MSVFNELLTKIFEISEKPTSNFKKELQDCLDCLGKFEEDIQHDRRRVRDKTQKDKNLMTTLQSIHEDDDESTKAAESAVSTSSDNTTTTISGGNGRRRASKKRSKDEVDGMSSPELDKRQRRNASVKAQGIISQQEKEILKTLNENGVVYMSTTQMVNVNLMQKLRREDTHKSSHGRRKNDNKENAEPVIIKIKQEKISIPSEPMETEVKPALVNDEATMPPPPERVSKARKVVQKKEEESSEEEGGSGRRRPARARKLTDAESMPPPPPPVPSARSTRAGSRASSRASSRVIKQTEAEAGKQVDTEELPPPEPRPKRTRAKKKESETISNESDKENTQVPQENGVESSAEKPRPKRTRRQQKAEEKEAQQQSQELEKNQKPDDSNRKETEKPKEQLKPEIPPKPQELKLITPKKERISEPTPASPLLHKNKTQKQNSDEEKTTRTTKITKPKKVVVKKQKSGEIDEVGPPLVESTTIMDETRVILIEKVNETVTITKEMDKTMVLPNGVYMSEVITTNREANETVILETRNRDTITLAKLPHPMDATVVIDKDPKPTNVSEDLSLLTDDNSEFERTPPKQISSPQQPKSAVKEKVQQFEELAARTTRTKTRAMAKMAEQDNHTPPQEKATQPVLSAETLNKMNSMIFNGKPPQVSSSASKPRTNIPAPPKQQPASTSKLSAINRHKETAEETLKREKEDARKKKEAMLEAKRELQKKKREDKMAAAAAAREAAERDRKLALQSAAKERMEKQAHADLGKLERLKEVERKKQELARKVAETEERRKAEEQARQQRLAEEQKRSEAARRKQLEEAEAMKKEAAIVAKEIEKRQKEYILKQKLKQKYENDKSHTPFKMPGTPGYCPQEPVYMADGFQYLVSDEESENVTMPVPAWSTTKARKLILVVQSHVSPALIDRLFSVRVHSPDLREIFPNIERKQLKRTSSAVWRTPPRLPPVHE